MIIRTLFGNVLSRINSSTTTPWESDLKSLEEYSLQHEFVTFTWGLDNHVFLKNRGYESILMSEFPYISNVDKRRTTNYFTKLYSLKKGIELFDKVVFLDWDTHLVADIPADFYKKLNGEFLVPLYSYEKSWADYRGIINELHRPLTDSWSVTLEEKTYSVWPCGCFIYCNNEDIVDFLLNIFKQSYRPWVNAKEETVFQQYINYQLGGMFDFDSYLKLYEPYCTYGQLNTAMEGTAAPFNLYLDEIGANKDIIFEHRSDLGNDLYYKNIGL